MARKDEKMFTAKKSRTALQYRFPAHQMARNSPQAVREMGAFQHRWWQRAESEFRARNRNGCKYFKRKDFLQITVR